VPNILIRSQSRLEISTTQFNIIVQLLSYWIDLARPPFPPKRDLAQRMSITQQTLRINIKALEEKRYISRVQQKTAAGDYGLNISLSVRQSQARSYELVEGYIDL
jgi:DNA-binding MarR family transcriptional regulator